IHLTSTYDAGKGSAMQQDLREIVITGATGGLGSDVISQLQRFAPPAELGVSVRTPGKAVVLSGAGIRVRRGDFNEPASLDHASEGYLASSGAAYTVLRNGQYIENLPTFLGAGAVTGDLALPPDGPTAWVSRIDLAEGIARLLLKDAPLPESILLTGPEALDF